MSKPIHATRDQLIEWIRFKAGELSLSDVSDDTLLLMAEGLEPGDVVIMPTGAYLKIPSVTINGDTPV